MASKPIPFNLRPSAADRWGTCTRSPWLEQHYPNTSSPAAEWGTRCHHFADIWLKTGAMPEIEDEEMAECAGEYVNYVGTYVDESADLFSEIKFDLSDLVLGMKGTSDAIVISGTHVDGFDLKTGKGVTVYAEGNRQGVSYLIGAVRFLESLGYVIKTCTFHIVQSRIGHIDTWDLTREELEAFAITLTAAAEDVFAGGSFRPSDKACRFCLAAGDCKARAKWSLEKAVGQFDDLDEGLNKLEALEAPSDILTDDEVSRILDRLAGLEAWVSQIRGGALARALRGGTITGRKLVLGTKHRKWINEAQVEAAFQLEGLDENQWTKRSLVSPAVAAKLLGKTHPIVVDMAIVPDGEPTLVSESDKRPPWSPARVEFENLDAEPELNKVEF